MRAIPERLRGVITTRRYTNPRLSYLTCGSVLGLTLFVLYTAEHSRVVFDHGLDLQRYVSSSVNDVYCVVDKF